MVKYFWNIEENISFYIFLLSVPFTFVFARKFESQTFAAFWNSLLVLCSIWFNGGRNYICSTQFLRKNFPVRLSG